MITVSGLAKGYGARKLFRDVTFQLSPGRRIAPVGGNGAGKTTLLEIVLGLIDADAGEVHRPRDETIGYLPQEITEWGDGSVLDEVLAGRPRSSGSRELIRLHDQIAATEGPSHDRALAPTGRRRAASSHSAGTPWRRTPTASWPAWVRALRRGAPARGDVGRLEDAGGTGPPAAGPARTC